MGLKGAAALMALFTGATIAGVTMASRTNVAFAEKVAPIEFGEHCRRFVIMVGYTNEEARDYGRWYESLHSKYKPFLQDRPLEWVPMASDKDPLWIYQHFLPALRHVHPDALFVFLFKNQNWDRDFNMLLSMKFPNVSDPAGPVGFAVVKEGWGAVRGWDHSEVASCSHEMLHLATAGTWHKGSSWYDPSDLSGMEIKRPAGFADLPWWDCAIQRNRL